MAQDIYIKIDGIEGESMDDAHSGEIDVLSWNWEVSLTSTMQSGGGGAAGKATVHDLEFVHDVDKASPNLLKYCLTGKHIPEAVLSVRRAGGSPLDYLKITMNDIIITKVSPGGSRQDEAKLTETIGLSFAKVKQEYAVQNLQGGSSGTVTAAFDIKANKES